FVTWERHQQKRAKYSKYPHPPANDGGQQTLDSNCNHVPAIVPEKRETRNEKRDTRQTDETRAHTHVQAAAGESAQVRESSVSPSVGQSIGLPVDAAEPSPDMAAVARHYGERIGMLGPSIFADLGDWHNRGKIGRASCRERGGGWEGGA